MGHVTVDPYDRPLAASHRLGTGESRARTAVGVVARTLPLAAVAADAWLLSGRDLSTQWWYAWSAVLAVIVAAAVCIWHGVRREHERGRVFAIVALLLAIPVFLMGTWGGMTRECPGPRPSRCVDRGVAP